MIPQIIRFLRRDLLFKGTTNLATTLNTLTTSLQCSGNQLEAMWCQEPLTHSVFYYDAILLVSLTPLLEALSNSKVLLIGFIY